jgi:glycosyltransferase involved in cell wall biosynthesis
MARIAVAHADLTANGGPEAVCANVIEALQGVHDVALLTLTPPDLNDLNRAVGTAVRDVDVRRPRWATLLVERLDISRDGLRSALLNRFVADRRDEFDLVVGTDGELGVSGPLVQYVHAPQFVRLSYSKRVGEDRFRDHLADRLAWTFGGYDSTQIRSSRLLAATEWSADVMQDAYGERPTVVRPPVDTHGFDEVHVPWEDREPGFVTVGPLAPPKNQHRRVEILDRLRDRGHDVHLHLVGPANDDERGGEYADERGSERAHEIEALAADREYVHLDGEVSREKLAELVATHRYGLHGARHGGFPTAVARLLAGGALTFAANRKGLREHVGSDDLTYSTTDEAVECIGRVLSDPELARELRRAGSEVEDRFGRRRFHRTVREVVAEELP